MRRVILPVSALFFFFLLIQLRGADTQPVGSCPTLVRDAIMRVEQVCSGTGRNQICYGHSAMTAEFRPEITNVQLEFPGDVTEIHNLNRVQLFPLDIDSEEWGLALMRVQANLPDTLPGQNVLFLLFGDVELSPEPAQQLVSTQSNVSTPPVTAFRLRSGVGAPQCDTAPPDGLLIQTPHGVGRVELTLNGVDVSLGSTVYFTAQENSYLTVNTLEGSALVRTEDGESLALAGSQVQVPLNANLEPAAPPMLPQPYQLEGFDHLPLEALERPVEVHPPLTEEEIEIVQEAVLRGEAQVLLPEVTPEATDQLRPDCPGNSCVAQTPDAPANTGTTDAGNSEQGGGNPPANPANPGQGGSNPPANPGQGGSPPGQGGGSPPGQGGGNPGQGGGSPPGQSGDNPGQGGGSPPGQGGGSPPGQGGSNPPGQGGSNPGQGGGNPGQGGGNPPADPGQGGNPPGQGGGNPGQGGGNPGQGGGNPGQGGGNPPADPGNPPPDNPGQGGGNPGQGGGNPGQGGGNPGQGGGNPGQGGGGQPTPTPTG